MGEAGCATSPFEDLIAPVLRRRYLRGLRCTPGAPQRVPGAPGDVAAGAVASARKRLAATQPKVSKGRPRTKAAKAAARKKKRLDAQHADWFIHRLLFVQHHLSQRERKTWWPLTRGLPELRTLRDLMERVYAFFDRRCRTQTALDQLATLRRRLLRLTQLGETLQRFVMRNAATGSAS